MIIKVYLTLFNPIRNIRELTVDCYFCTFPSRDTSRGPCRVPLRDNTRSCVSLPRHNLVEWVSTRTSLLVLLRPTDGHTSPISTNVVETSVTDSDLGTQFRSELGCGWKVSPHSRWSTGARNTPDEWGRGAASALTEES